LSYTPIPPTPAPPDERGR